VANDSTLKQLEQILAKRQKYQVKTGRTKRDLDSVDGTLQELANVVATLINDLKKQGILK
jgi:hypothetical protein